MMDRTATFYSGPSYTFRGAGFPVYAGSRRQRGGSVLGALKNVMMPLGTVAAKQALGLAGDVAMDAIRGRKITDSLKTHGLRRLKNVGMAGIKSIIPGAFGRKVSRKRPSRKSRSHPPAKRRRRFGLF